MAMMIEEQQAHDAYQEKILERQKKLAQKHKMQANIEKNLREQTRDPTWYHNPAKVMNSIKAKHRVGRDQKDYVSHIEAFEMLKSN